MNHMSTFALVGGSDVPFTRTPANVPNNHFESDSQGTVKEKTKKRSAPTSHNAGGADEHTARAKVRSRASTAAPAKKKKKRAVTSLPARQIPRSFHECTEADQKLITMRDANVEWKVIRAQWEELTGEKTGNSTLPNRYARLKSNFTVIREEDNGRLIEAKRTVEEAFEKEKWDLIAKAVQQKGGDNYAGVVLQRQYKKLMISHGAHPPSGVRDPDFDGVELPDDSEADE